MIRSMLFAPANRPDLIAKFERIPADAFVLDLEDGTPPGERAAARAGLPELYRAARDAKPGALVMVRVNPIGSADFEADCQALSAAGTEYAVLPKVENEAQVARLHRHAPFIVVGIETPLGVLRAPEIAAAAGVMALYFGAEDLVAEMDGLRTDDNREVLHARSHVALAAKAHKVQALDLVTIAVRDGEQFDRDVQQGREIGYSGKMCIAPGQVAQANAAYQPTESQIDFARRVVAAAEAGARDGKGVISVDGRMIDTPLVRQAQSILSTFRGQDV
ncbi:HpcH/HpaI aldolase/citrate lyase family protein [Maricaulis salignorans]|uniref:Citrate lyase subunit beta / citryl-CoA lyase n=1 Tax=Maricaulis salignorans TaxID=144026 RepID=A0A1G9LSZ0_9PROT|nr:CoA ester lyase [Maricaulis salignorans]SDL64904.1 citrate lyase subunit beta / citryl-CoA lyase [Maricaulis salignorans]